MIIYSIPGFQAQVIGLSVVRDIFSKKYAAPLSMDFVFGLTIISIMLYTGAFIHIFMQVSKKFGSKNFLEN